MREHPELARQPAAHTRLDPAHRAMVAPLARAGLSEPQVAADLLADPFGPLLQAAAMAAPMAEGGAGAPGPANGRLEGRRGGREPSPDSSGDPSRDPGAARGRLLQRVTRSAVASRAMHTRRHADALATVPVPGVALRGLYRAMQAQAPRPGEPDAVTLVELAPGATWAGPADALQREWLVLRGRLELGALTLHEHDYHVVPAGRQAGAFTSRAGALLYQRETRAEPGAAQQCWTQRTEGSEWSDFGPGIKRRVLWQQAGQAAMLYHAMPGAAVPHHGHRHDEECLMLGGDLFLDEVLLRTLDYQIAPAGTEHQSVLTDTGVLLFAHGDLELDLKAA